MPLTLTEVSMEVVISHHKVITNFVTALMCSNPFEKKTISTYKITRVSFEMCIRTDKAFSFFVRNVCLGIFWWGRWQSFTKTKTTWRRRQVIVTGSAAFHCTCSQDNIQGLEVDKQNFILKVRKSQIRKFQGSFLYSKSATFLGVWKGRMTIYL